ncbi:MAG: hypothetical protein ABFD00_05260, partial [Chloroherpetonaceae bacterium]
MKKEVFFLIFGFMFLLIIETNAQYTTNNIPRYLKPDFNEYYIGNPNLPSIFTRKVVHTYVPPEVAKYVPERTRIQTADGFELI